MAESWMTEPRQDSSPPLATPKFQPKQQPSLAERLGWQGVARLIRDYRSGSTAQELADRHGCSCKTIKRLLQAHHVRLDV